MQQLKALDITESAVILFVVWHIWQCNIEVSGLTLGHTTHIVLLLSQISPPTLFSPPCPLPAHMTSSSLPLSSHSTANSHWVYILQKILHQHCALLWPFRSKRQSATHCLNIISWSLWDECSSWCLWINELDGHEKSHSTNSKRCSVNFGSLQWVSCFTITSSIMQQQQRKKKKRAKGREKESALTKRRADEAILRR